MSALDVSIQAGIINLLLDLQERFGLSYLFVSHDLSVVKHLAHRVAVMYKGAIVEQGDGDQVFANPQHEYTKRLLKSVPQPPPDVAGSGAQPPTQSGAEPPPEPPPPSAPKEPPPPPPSGPDQGRSRFCTADRRGIGGDLRARRIGCSRRGWAGTARGDRRSRGGRHHQ